MAIKSGTATITVKAKENNVKGEIQIKVFTPVTGIELTVQNIVMQVGDQFAIKPIVTPSDADNKNVIYSSKDESIANIDTKGNITATREGNTKIIITTEDGGLEKEIDIIVVKKLSQEEIKFDESLKVMQNEITGWDIEKLNVENIKDKIQTLYNIEIYDYKGNELKEGQKVGTGSKIKLVDENNNIKMEYYIIIYGDVNGDGTGSVKLKDLKEGGDDKEYCIPGEFLANGYRNTLKHIRGTISMARLDYSSLGLNEEGYNSAGAQFYITLGDTTTLDGNYAAFGRVTDGWEVLDKLNEVELKPVAEDSTEQPSEPVNPPVIESVEIDTFGIEYSLPQTVEPFDYLNWLQSQQSVVSGGTTSGN